MSGFGKGGVCRMGGGGGRRGVVVWRVCRMGKGFVVTKPLRMRYVKNMWRKMMGEEGMQKGETGILMRLEARN